MTASNPTREFTLFAARARSAKIAALARIRVLLSGDEKEKNFVSETSVNLILKHLDLITNPVYVVS